LRTAIFALCLVAVASLLVGFGLAGWLWLWPAQGDTDSDDLPPDPRLTYKGPFENIHPSVAYVGNRACADCHPKIVERYSSHPMARTLAPFQGPLPDQPADAAHHHPFTALGMRMELRRQGKGWDHRLSWTDEGGRTLTSLDLPVGYSIGSGEHGRSYLTVRDGFVSQTPVSWFSQKKIWDLSPGFREHTVHGRPVPEECLFCHSSRVEAVPGYRNRFKEPLFPLDHGVGCERCHGPGEKHIEGPTTQNIVQPGKLPWKLRENVCEQCHFQSETRVTRRGRDLFDWRPGLPLEEFLAVFLPQASGGRAYKANGHVEQLRQSVCFQKSPEERKLGCISCHDPHRHTEKTERVAHYRQRCLNCHKNRGCSLSAAERRRQVADDSCIECHMRRHTADIAHTALTDHRILRFGKSPRSGEVPGEGVVNGYLDRLPPDDPEGRRDLGIALVDLVVKDVLRRPLAPRALDLLNEALRRAPRDVEARVARADLQRWLSRFREARRDYEAVLSVMPENEWALLGATQATFHDGLLKEARDYAERLVRLNPYRASYREALCLVLQQQGKVDEGVKQARGWLELAPTSLTARTYLFRLLLRAGRRDEARRELELLRRARAPNLDGLESQLRQESH
jgi:tetratricopeptide (TPR) repeat protein